jgi:hypothetical protein
VTTFGETPVQGQASVRPGPSAQPTGQSPPPRDQDGGFSHAWRTYPALRLAALVLFLGIAALVVWFAFLRSGDESASAQPGAGPVGASEVDLAALSVRLGQPVYWAGQRPGTEFEATVTTNQYVYVRYLTAGAQVGDSSPQFLTVATYPAVDALGNLRSYANHGRAKITRIPGGGIAVPVPGSPTSVYFAGPDSDYQVEVYDPNEGEALDLIGSGEVVPVSGGVNPSDTPSG